jgi:tetratricopeptide (TPR) repeat protein
MHLGKRFYVVSKGEKMEKSKEREELPFGELSFKTLSLRFFLTLGSSVATIYLIVSIVEWLSGWRILASTGLIGIAFFIMLCGFVSITSVLVAIMTGYRQVISENKRDVKNLDNALIVEIEKAYNEKKWEEVIKIGSVLSRPLWITGKYHLRIQLGKFIENAAGYLNNPSVQASALIDDLGWTKYTLGEINEAQENIEHGIQIAIKSQEPFLAYKGFRHLSSIAVDLGHLMEAEKYLEEVKAFAYQLPEGNIKQEAIGGIHFTVGLLERKRKNWAKALVEYTIADEIYRALRDNERIAKVYQYKGEALFELGRFSESKDVYLEGYSVAQKESRKDSILQNLLGLSNISIKIGDITETRRILQECTIIAKELDRVDLLKAIRRKLHAL